MLIPLGMTKSRLLQKYIKHKRVDNMKIKYNFRKKEISGSMDVEKLVEKGIDTMASRPSRHQIREEEKRKTAELAHKHEMKKLYLLIGTFFILLLFAIIMAFLEK